jgi:hypothetical protein
VNGEAKIREALLGAAVAAETGACPSPDVLWHAASGNLQAAAMGEVLDHLAVCGPCTEDFRIVQRVAREAPVASPAPSLLRRVAASMVAPVPALAYLVLACVCLALLVRGPAARLVPTASPGAPSPPVAGEPALASVIPELRLTGDVATRGEAGGASPVDVARARVLLRLYVDEAPTGLGELDRLRVGVRSGRSLLWAEERPARDLPPDGSLPLLLDLSSRQPEEILTVAIDHVEPGGRIERLFEQTLRVAAR